MDCSRHVFWEMVFNQAIYHFPLHPPLIWFQTIVFSFISCSPFSFKLSVPSALDFWFLLLQVTFISPSIQYHPRLWACLPIQEWSSDKIKSACPEPSRKSNHSSHKFTKSRRARDLLQTYSNPGRRKRSLRTCGTSQQMQLSISHTRLLQKQPFLNWYKMVLSH